MKDSTGRFVTKVREQHAFLYADLLSTLERMVVAGHVRHDCTLIWLGCVDQIYMISREYNIKNLFVYVTEKAHLIVVPS